MATQKRVTAAVAEIRKKYGKIIDLEKTPLVLVEIFRQYGDVLQGVGGGTGGGGGGGTGGPGVSTVAVGVNDGGTNDGGGGGGGGVSPGTGDGGTGTGGVSAGTSTVAVGITPPESGFGHLELEEILKAVLKLQKQVGTMGVQIERIATKTK